MSRRSHFRRVQHERFSRQWWLTFLKNSLWVGLVTLLIWIYADLKFTDSKQLRTTLRLKASNLALLSTGEVRVAFRLEGSREGLDRYERDMKEYIVYDAAREFSAGQHQVRVRDILNNDPVIAKAGLRVTSTSPETIEVILDNPIHETVPILPVVANAELVEQPQRTVGITVAKSLWEEILRRQPKPVLKTNEVDLKNRETGKPINITFELAREIEGFPVKPDTDSVEMPVEISQRTDKKKLTVTVRVLVLPDWDDLRKYDFVRKDPLEWRPEIVVTGPRADLDKLDPKDVEAYIVLREDDKKFMETWTARPVQVRFPPGLQLQIDGSPPVVNFRLDRRNEIVPTPPPAP
ncbi:MAG: hypothetical protein WC869_06125 [Phycisphaerae bacterium]|jgi:hypothetical protein